MHPCPFCDAIFPRSSGGQKRRISGIYDSRAELQVRSIIHTFPWKVVMDRLECLVSGVFGIPHARCSISVRFASCPGLGPVVFPTTSQLSRVDRSGLGSRKCCKWVSQEIWLDEMDSNQSPPPAGDLGSRLGTRISSSGTE